MSYIVLARRFRPQIFDEIIGQEHVSRTLKNAIAENRVAHAYLFSGPRGVGKTTTARILAKALNCKQGPTHTPCDKCTNCREIISGSSIDVQEIDGASNRGIDEIRALRENVKFSPATSKYKIYIIDEAHQITDAAFNALLKTLEEPPSHVIFILATTDPQKIPLTILSRCQRYRFRLISFNEIMDCFEKIIKTEKFEIEHDALQVITESAGGSLRDALSLMDQVVSFVSGKVTLNDIQNLLGFLPKDIICTTVKALSEQDSAKLLSIIKEIAEQGYSLTQFGRDLREHFRRILLFMINPSVLEIIEEDKKILEGQKSLFSTIWLVRSGHMLSKMLDEMRWSGQPRLILELYILRLAQPYVSADTLVERLDELENNIPIESSVEQISSQKSYSEQPKPENVEKIANPLEEPENEANYTKENASNPEPASASLEQDLSGLWSSALSEFRHSNPLIANMLAGSVIKDIKGNNLILAVKNTLQQEGVERNQSAIEKIIQEKSGRQLALNISVDSKLSADTLKKGEEIIVKEESYLPPSGEVFEVADDFSKQKDALPQEMDKIVSKFPGKVTKKNRG